MRGHEICMSDMFFLIFGVLPWLGWLSGYVLSGLIVFIFVFIAMSYRQSPVMNEKDTISDCFSLLKYIFNYRVSIFTYSL